MRDPAKSSWIISVPASLYSAFRDLTQQKSMSMASLPRHSAEMESSRLRSPGDGFFPFITTKKSMSLYGMPSGVAPPSPRP